MKYKKKILRKFSFAAFAKLVSDYTGSVWGFVVAIFTVIIWAISGPFFRYSENWQLLINTGTTIITFLMVFLIQNTQNRDTKILDLKLDELIKSHNTADNNSIDLSNLSDEDLKKMEDYYKKICKKVNKNTK